MEFLVKQASGQMVGLPVTFIKLFEISHFLFSSVAPLKQRSKAITSLIYLIRCGRI